MELGKARATRLAPRTGGRVLADALVAQGIAHAFAVPGESYLDVLDGLYAVREKLHLTTCRIESGAVHMAEAIGKLTGRPAAAFVTRGPGACHAAIGVHVAFQDSTPLLLFVGQIPFEETDRESFQEIDYRRMFQPLAKWVTQIDDAARIPELVAHAVERRHQWPPRPGGDRPVGGNAETQRRSPRYRPRPGVPPASRPGGAGTHDRPAGPREQATRHPRRQWLERAGARRYPRLPGRQRPARRRELPPPGAVRRHARHLCGRSRRRLGPGAGGACARGRPDPGHRHPPGRGGHPGLHPVRPGRPHADRACASRPRRNRPGVPPRARHHLRPQPVRRRRGETGAGEAGLGRVDTRAAGAAPGRAGGAAVPKGRSISARCCATWKHCWTRMRC